MKAKESKKKKSGKQDSKLHIGKYCEIYKKILQNRQNKHSARSWESYIFKRMKQDSLLSWKGALVVDLPLDDLEDVNKTCLSDEECNLDDNDIPKVSI